MRNRSPSKREVSQESKLALDLQLAWLHSETAVSLNPNSKIPNEERVQEAISDERGVKSVNPLVDRRITNLNGVLVNLHFHIQHVLSQEEAAREDTAAINPGTRTSRAVSQEHSCGVPLEGFKKLPQVNEFEVECMTSPRLHNHRARKKLRREQVPAVATSGASPRWHTAGIPPGQTAQGCAPGPLPGSC